MYQTYLILLCSFIVIASSAFCISVTVFIQTFIVLSRQFHVNKLKYWGQTQATLHEETIFLFQIDSGKGKIKYMRFLGNLYLLFIYLCEIFLSSEVVFLHLQAMIEEAIELLVASTSESRNNLGAYIHIFCHFWCRPFQVDDCDMFRYPFET